jgi:hypothetical protein
MPMHDWLFNQEYNLEQCLGEEGLASVFAVTNWRYVRSHYYHGSCSKYGTIWVSSSLQSSCITHEPRNARCDCRMILIGQTHTMFNLHTDNVDSATWQTQIKGRKRWRVCPPTETP